MEVPWEEASRFGLMVADEDDRITEFQEKPKNPKSNLASMGIYIFNWDVLKKYLIEDEADPNSENDFGNNIIPNLLKDGETCTLIILADTGKMSEPSRLSGKRIWRSLIRSTAVSTYLMMTGRSTAGTVA